MRRAGTLVGLALVVLSGIASAAPPGHLEGYLPVAANGPGRFESFWTTDAWVYQQGATVLHLWFNPAGRDNTDVESVVVPLDGPVTHIADIVGSLFGTEGIGSVHYLADGPVSVISRTWTAGREGGTYGQTIPGQPITSASLAGSGQGGALRMLVDQVPESRVNLGLVNVSPVAVTVAVDIFTADGEPAPGASSFTVELEPYGMTQVGDVLQRLDPGTRQGLIVRAGVISAEGGILAYLSTADNTTNDAAYQEGFRFAY